MAYGTIKMGDIVAVIKADSSEFTKAIGQAQTMTGKFTSGLKGLASDIGSFATKATIAGGVLATAMGVATKSAVNYAGDLQQIEKGLTTLLGSSTKAQEALNQIKVDAMKTPFDLRDLARANQMLISTGLSAKDSRKVILDLGNAIVATGGGNEEFSRMVVNLQQIKNIGKATAMDIRQFGFAGINIYRMLSEATGKSIDEIKESGVTFEMLAEGLDKSAKSGGMYANALQNMGGSWNLAKANLKDIVGLLGADIVTRLGLFEYLNNGLNTLNDFLMNNKEQIIAFFLNIKDAITNFVASEQFQAFLNTLKSFGEWIMANQETVITFLQGLAVAIGALVVIGTIINLINMLTNPITILIGVIALLYTAWTQNWGGIRDFTMNIVNQIKGFYEAHKADFEYIFNGIKEFIAWFIALVKQWWSEYGQYIMNTAKVMLEFVKNIFKNSFDVIMGIIKFFVALFKGDWEGMWNAVVQIVTSGWNNVKAIFNTFSSVAEQALKALWDSFTSWFSKIWNTAKEYADKIRSAISKAFDVNKRNSPSIMDRLIEIKSSAEGVLGSIEVPQYNHAISDSFSGLGTSSSVVQNVNVYPTDRLDLDIIIERLAYKYRTSL